MIKVASGIYVKEAALDMFGPTSGNISQLKRVGMSASPALSGASAPVSGVTAPPRLGQLRALDIAPLRPHSEAPPQNWATQHAPAPGFTDLNKLWKERQEAKARSAGSAVSRAGGRQAVKPNFLSRIFGSIVRSVR